MTSDRDGRLIQLRSDISFENSKLNITEASSKFQTVVLRPILRFQNSIILAQFKQYLIKFKPAFNAYNSQVQKNYIQDVLKSDSRIKNSLIASVISVMTLEEYLYYCENKNEINKRIVALLTKCIQDQLEMLF